MKKFEVGQRVAVYAGTRIKGTVASLDKDLGVEVKYDEPIDTYSSGYYHPKQCRLLRNKERKEWTGVWTRADKIFSSVIVFVPNGPRAELISLMEKTATLKEVRRRK